MSQDVMASVLAQRLTLFKGCDKVLEAVYGADGLNLLLVIRLGLEEGSVNNVAIVTLDADPAQVAGASKRGELQGEIAIGVRKERESAEGLCSGLVEVVLHVPSGADANCTFEALVPSVLGDGGFLCGWLALAR